MPAKRPSNFVYVATVGDWTKIGVSSDVARRAKILCAEQSKCVHMVRTWDIGHRAIHVERAAHDVFRNQRAPFGTEYFTVEASTAIAAVDAVIVQMFGRPIRSKASKASATGTHQAYVDAWAKVNEALAAVVAEAEKLFRQGKIISEVARELGVKRQTIANHWTAEEARRLAKRGPLKPKKVT